MGFVTTFDYAAWTGQYPTFAKVSQAAAAGFFALSTIYWRNDGSSPARTQVLQDQLLYMLTAHIAWLQSPRDAGGTPDSTGTQLAPSIVGRISSASEGSVSVSTENSYAPGSAQWFQQTQWGSLYWQATLPFRSGPRWVPPWGSWPGLRVNPFPYPWRP